MATKQQQKSDETQADETKDVKDTTETVPAGEQTTKPVATPDKVEETDEKQRQDEALDEVLAEDAKFGDDDFGDSLGGVQEDGLEVPWRYITLEDFNEDSSLIRTSDSDDGDVVKWNVQKAFETETKDDVEALVAVQATPGQTFTLAELPNIEVMRAAGINVAQFLSGLPVRPEVEGERRRGIPA